MEHIRDLLEGLDGFKGYRILEYQDLAADMDDLKGDYYNPKVNNDIDPITLKEQGSDFEEEVNREGVFGYVLERWNPETGKGWEHVDCCWGFVGQHNEKSNRYNHYIIEELKAQAVLNITFKTEA